jgi:hypothetical protein
MLSIAWEPRFMKKKRRHRPDYAASAGGGTCIGRIFINSSLVSRLAVWPLYKPAESRCGG